MVPQNAKAGKRAETMESYTERPPTKANESAAQFPPIESLRLPSRLFGIFQMAEARNAEDIGRFPFPPLEKRVQTPAPPETEVGFIAAKADADADSTFASPNQPQELTEGFG